MRAIGIIPARMGSERFPGKPLALINGEPMVHLVYRAAANSKFIYPVYVATSDEAIAASCEEADIPFLATRSTCRTGTERVTDAVSRLNFRDDDIVLNIQGDEPTIRPDSLDKLAVTFYDPKVQVASLCCVPKRPGFMPDRNRVKVIVGKDGNARGFQRGPVSPFLTTRQHVGVYAFRRGILERLARLDKRGDLEQTAWLQAKIPIRMVEIDYEPVAVDLPGDIPLAGKALLPL